MGSDRKGKSVSVEVLLRHLYVMLRSVRTCHLPERLGPATRMATEHVLSRTATACAGLFRANRDFESVGRRFDPCRAEQSPRE